MRYFLIIFSLGLVVPGLLYHWFYGWRFEPDHPAVLSRLADQAARRHQLDPKLFRALITEESAWRVEAVSPRGAMGLGQLMPATARELGVKNAFDPAQNLDGSARYLAAMLKRFQSVELALCAYHAGPGKVRELGRCPRFPDTQRYLQRVLRAWKAED